MNELITHLAAAFGIGLLIGVERERRKGGESSRAPAGVRTFTLTAVLGGLSYHLGAEIIFAICTVFVGAAILVSYYRTQEEDPGLTTEIALLLTFLLGAFAMRDPAFASGLAVVVALVLAVREKLHRFINTVLNEQEIHDGLILAAAVLVILPLLPDRALDPLGVFNPHLLWRIVVLMLFISAGGYIAIRILGVRYGLPLAGLASGFISSAATIGMMGARAAREPKLFDAAVAGAVLSTVATIVQLVVIFLVTSLALLKAMILPLTLAGLAAVGYGLYAMYRNRHIETDLQIEHGRAFDLKVALIFAALVGGVLLVSALLMQWLGVVGVMLTAAVAGMADAHSPAISVATLGEAQQITLFQAGIAVLIALTTNTGTKLLAARVSGDRRFTLALLPGLLAVLIAAWVGFFVQMKIIGM